MSQSAQTILRPSPVGKRIQPLSMVSTAKVLVHTLLLIQLYPTTYSQPPTTSSSTSSPCLDSSSAPLGNSRVCSLDIRPCSDGGGYIAALLPLHGKYSALSETCARSSFLAWAAVRQTQVSTKSFSSCAMRRNGQHSLPAIPLHHCLTHFSLLAL